MAAKDTIVMEGALGFRNKKQFIKRMKEHHVVLYGNSGSGLARLEIYENKKEMGTNSYTTLIVGSDVVKVKKLIVNMPETHNKSFTVDTKEQQQYTFAAQTYSECDAWVNAIQSTLFAVSAPKPTIPNTVTEDNDIYLPAEEITREFKVNMAPETRQKLAADNPVRLLIENGHITVISLDGNRIVRWSIVHLRRMGHSDEDFHIETGRKSERGPGEFTFNTKMGKQIHNLVNKEKEVCRQNNPILPAGQVSCPILPDPASLPRGDHIYEEVTPAFTSSAQRLSDLTSQAQLHRRTMSQELLPNASNGTTPAAPRSPGGGWAGKKPTPTAAYPAQVANTVMRSIGDAKIDAKPANTDAIYSEPGVPPDPWKTFGRGDDDDMYEAAPQLVQDAMYDNLQHLTPVANTKYSQEDPYSLPVNSKPDADAACLESIRKMQMANQQQQKEKKNVPVEDLYATVDISKKTKKKK